MSEVKEVGEIAEDLVSVFIQIPRERLAYCTGSGLRMADNRMTEKSARARLEEIFEEERLKAGVSVSRTKCVFAYPRHPKQMSNRLSFDSSREILLEVYCDPQTAVVVPADYYTEASVAIVDDSCGEERIREYASSYWAEAQTLAEYQRTTRGVAQDDGRFREVLIPEDIPPERLKVVAWRPEMKESLT